VLPFSSGKNNFAHRDGGRFFVGAALCLMRPFDGFKDQGPPDGLPNVVEVVVDEYVLFIAFMSVFHFLNALYLGRRLCRPAHASNTRVLAHSFFSGASNFSSHRAMKFLSFDRVFRARDLFCSFCGQAFFVGRCIHSKVVFLWTMLRSVILVRAALVYGLALGSCSQS
jgi:hypothetical protein